MRAKLTLAFALASVVVAAPALAQTPPAAAPAAPPVVQTPSGAFGQTGQLILGADRMFGLSFSSVKTETDLPTGTVSNTQSGTNINLLWAPEGLTPYEVPRLSADYIVVSSLTVGGAIGYKSQSTKNKAEAGGVSTEADGPSMHVFQIAPRVGYVLGLADKIAFWPRGGITFYTGGTESTSGVAPNQTTTKISMNGLALNVEAMFAFSPVQGFALIGGPLLDLPLSGSMTQEVTGQPNVDGKMKFMNWGLAFGMIGYF